MYERYLRDQPGFQKGQTDPPSTGGAGRVRVTILTRGLAALLAVLTIGGFYWSRPPMEMPEREVVGRQEGAVRAVAFSPDGGMVASSGPPEPAINVWEVAGPCRLFAMSDPSGNAFCLAFSPDGSTLAAGYGDGHVTLWTIPAGTPKAVFPRAAEGIHGVAFSPDGAVLAAGSVDGRIRVWDVQSEKLLATLGSDGAAVNTLAFSPDGKWLASGAINALVRIWDLVKGEPRSALRGHSGPVTSVAFAQGGQLLVSVAPKDLHVRVWDVNTGQQRTAFDMRGTVAGCVAIAPDGHTLAVAGAVGRITIGDLASGQTLAILRGHRGWVHSLSFACAGHLLASGGIDGTVRVWDLNGGANSTRGPQ